MDKAYIQTVVAELKQNAAAGNVPAATTVSETASAAEPAAAAQAAPAPTPTPAATEPGPDAAAAAASPDEDGPPTNFAQLMKKITGLQTAGLMTTDDTTEIAASLGLTGLRGMATRPDLIPSFDALLPVAA